MVLCRRRLGHPGFAGVDEQSESQCYGGKLGFQPLDLRAGGGGVSTFTMVVDEAGSGGLRSSFAFASDRSHAFCGPIFDFGPVRCAI